MSEILKNKVSSQIVGHLINAELSAKEAVEVLEESKNVFLGRSYHINSKKKADLGGNNK